MTLAIAVAAALAAGFLLETLLVRRGARAYFHLGFPLPVQLVPLSGPCTSEERGRAGPYLWARVAPGLLHFWSDPAERSAPTLLHGAVTLAVARGRTHLGVRWAPPWTPLVGCGWLIALGIARGEPELTVPIGLGLLAVVLIVYANAARGAAARIRFALQSDDGPPMQG